MKGDMGGAACVVATVMAIAQLECPVSVVGLVPLCENMPSGNAVKPGDVVTAMNGKTVVVSGIGVNTPRPIPIPKVSILHKYIFTHVHLYEAKNIIMCSY
jgi:hypothetical protein